jgi:hypothetical protein
MMKLQCFGTLTIATNLTLPSFVIDRFFSNSSPPFSYGLDEIFSAIFISPSVTHPLSFLQPPALPAELPGINTTFTFLTKSGCNVNEILACQRVMGQRCITLLVNLHHLLLMITRSKALLLPLPLGSAGCPRATTAMSSQLSGTSRIFSTASLLLRIPPSHTAPKPR